MIKHKNKENAVDNKKSEVPPNAVVLCSEPLKDRSVDDMRLWISQNRAESDLATAMSLVHRKSGWLAHLTDDEGGEIYAEESHKWWELEKELCSEIISIMKEENERGAANHNLEKRGWHYMIEPFMNRNGFRDGAGWWIKEKENTNEQE